MAGTETSIFCRKPRKPAAEEIGWQFGVREQGVETCPGDEKEALASGDNGTVWSVLSAKELKDAGCVTCRFQNGIDFGRMEVSSRSRDFTR